MHAVVTRVKIQEPETATQGLRENIVPRVREADGFQAGYWTRKGDTGLSMILVESEENANAIRDQIESAPVQGVTIEDVEVREVVVSA